MSDKESLNENQKENKEEENKDSKILQSEENVNKENPLEDKPEMSKSINKITKIIIITIKII